MGMEFVEQTKDIPEEAIVVLSNATVTLLVDDEGCLLQFR